ncbi:MAG: cell division protein FtsA, partial [Neisseriaceae bacterium]|nr:cell division protein FtsA [Neisseriaceae bacterium]
EVTREDINRAIEHAKAVQIPAGHQILHTVVQEFIVDNQPNIHEPLGMAGARLTVKVHIITGENNAVQNLEKCIQRAELIPETIVLQPLASALAVLTDDDQDLGVCCVDIGAGTIDICVFTNGAIRHTAVLPVAGEMLTQDLARGLRTPYEAAEHIKIYHGAAVDTLDGMDEMIEVPCIGNDRKSRQVERSVLVTEVLQLRLTEFFHIIINELQRAGFPTNQLAAGIILTGGTSLMAGMVDLAEDVFDLPVRVGVPSRRMGGLSERIRNPRYATAIGLLYQAFDEMEYNQTDERRPSLIGRFIGFLTKNM